MNQKTLIGLVVAALLALVAAIALNHAGKPQREGSGEASTWLAPQLRDHVNEVTKLIVTGAGDKTLALLERGANGWTLADKGGYAVDTGKLRAFLLALSEAKLVEQKTANRDKYALLGVEDVSAADAKGVEVELDGLAQPLKLIVGNASQNGGGTFVRRAGEAQSWLASGTLSVEKGAADWLKRDLANIPAERIESVTLTPAVGKGVRVHKDAGGDANFTLADIPKGREAGSEFTVNGLASTLSDLRFDDVFPAAEAPPGEAALQARYATFDGVVVSATAWQKDGKDFARFEASLDAQQADKSIAAAQAKVKAEYEIATAASAKDAKDAKANDAPIKPLAVSDPAKDRDNRLAALHKEVVDLDARFQGWTYVLPAYKYANMDKKLDDLLKPVEDKKPVEAASNAASAKAGRAGR